MWWTLLFWMVAPMEIAPTGMSGSLMLRTSFPSEGGTGDWGSTYYRTTCRATGSCTCEGKERMNIHILLEHYAHYTLKLSNKWSKWSACMCMGRLINNGFCMGENLPLDCLLQYMSCPVTAYPQLTACATILHYCCSDHAATLRHSSYMPH